MNGSHRPRIGSQRLSRPWRALTAAALVVSSVAVLSPTSASAAPLPYRIDLRVLLFDDNSPWVDAIESQMQVEGVPFTSLNLTAGTDFQSSNLFSGDHAFYQAVVLPSYAPDGLDATERTTLNGFESKFGVREVDAFNYPASPIGMNTPVFDGDLDGVTANVTAAGKAAGFGYLDGPVLFSIGSFTHIAAPLASLPAGEMFTPLVESQPPGGGITGSILGVYSHDNVEQLVITAAFASYQLQFKYLAHGIITWMTRGVHFGYNRNSFTMHIDDAFATDALWDPSVNCTPGEDCLGIGTERTARMTAADVSYAVAWMQANGYELTMAFNGKYAYEGGAPDPLADAFVGNAAAFRWLNHGYEHIYQGCQQDTSVLPWVCLRDAESNPLWVSQSDIYNEMHNNISAGQTLGLTFDATEYLSGEHSGLQFTSTSTPGQDQGDNPNFVAALSQAPAVSFIGTDASRETSARLVGGAWTIPRHPTALYYNTSTQADAVDEYNWLYTTAAAGGSGLCGTTVPPCINPLDLATGFTSYIVPTDARFNLGFILSNDPRPFYAHTTNMIADPANGNDRMLYHLLDSILGTYGNAFTSATPLLNLTLSQASTELVRQQQWAADSSDVMGYVQAGAISITSSTMDPVPFTAPAGSTINGATLESYGGELSAWLAPAASYTGTLPTTTLTTAGSVFVIGQSSTMTVTASGSPTTTAWLQAPVALPTGLTYTLVSGGVTVSGVPASATEGNYSINVTTISAGFHETRNVAFTVTRRPVITSASSALAIVGQPFTFDFVSNGSPTPVVAVSGSLPTGIGFTDLGSGSARLSGTAPDAAAGTYPITVTATNIGAVATQLFTLTVARPPTFTSDASATAVAGEPFNFAVVSDGYPAAPILMTGALPSGLDLTDNGNGTATLSGTPAHTGAGRAYPLTFTTSNVVGDANQTFSLMLVDHTPLVSIAPARLADTRPGEHTVDGLYEGQGMRATGSTLELQVAGRGGVPTDATAVALNVTVAEAFGSGFVTVYPCGSGQPLASNLNFTAGAVVPNAVIAKIGDGGKVCLLVSNATQLIVDVNGFFPNTSTFSSMNPARLLETRSGPEYSTIDGLQQGDGIRGRNTVTTLHVTDRAGVPSDVAAVVLNVTVTEAQGPGFVTVYPCGPDIPTASNLNYTTGSTVANMVVAMVDADGNVCLYNNEATHLVVDVNGYFPSDGSYFGMSPARLLETRPALDTIDGEFENVGLLPNGTVTSLVVAGRGNVPVNAKTVVLNVTVTESVVPGFITVYPCSPDIPLASNLNYDVGTTSAIAVIAQIPSSGPSAGKVCLFNSGATQLVTDVNGYLVN